MAINNHVVNTNGRGANAFSNTFHGLRRTQDGKLYYTLRDANVGTFSNDGGTTELSSDADYVAVVEQYISGKNQTFAGDGSDTTFTLSDTGREADQIAVFVDRVRMTATTDTAQSPRHLNFNLPSTKSAIFLPY